MFPATDDALWATPYEPTPDTLNLASLVHDALEGVIYENDKQVCRSIETKIWGERCEVRVMLSQWIVQ